MRIAVTGQEGQVARALAERGAADGVDLVFLSRPAFDLSDPATIAPALRAARADVVINAAAYTAVDKAESEPALAHAINAVGAGAVAQAAAALGLPILHLSTDYVFDGAKPAPYRESDATGPVSVYGQTKLGGEQAVTAANPAHVILRTAWVFSPFGANFVKTMLRLAATRDEIGVVADQRGCPASALDIAQVLLAIAKRVVRDPSPAHYGVFHMGGQGEAVWADVAEAVFRIAAEHAGPTARVRRIASADYPTPAKRPANSRLDSTKLKDIYGLTLPLWTQAVETCTIRLLREGWPG